MKKSINYRNNKICKCNSCEKSFMECDVIKQATELQKEYNFTMNIHYDVDVFESKTSITTPQPLPFLMDKLKYSAEQCRKAQGIQR